MSTHYRKRHRYISLLLCNRTPPCAVQELQRNTCGFRSVKVEARNWISIVLLCNGQVRGYASKSAHFHVIRWLIDWLIDWVRGYASKSAHFKNRYFPEKNRPNSANSALTMGIGIILCIKQKWRPNLRWFFRKNGKKSSSNVYLINQSTIP